MTAPLPSAPSMMLLRAKLLVSTGLAVFARRTLEPLPSLFSDLDRSRELGACLGTSDSQWSTLVHRAHAERGEEGCVLARFAREFELSPAEIFLVTLCGEVERDARIHWALQALMGEGACGRPTLALSAMLVETLFDEVWDAPRLAHHRLVRAGVLQRVGEGPLPSAELRLAPALWAVLGRQPVEPLGCKLLRPHGSAPLGAVPLGAVAEQRLARAAELLREGSARGVLLRGSTPAVERSASELAQLLGRSAVRLDARAAAQPWMGWLARYAEWLPLLVFELGPGELLAVPEISEQLPVVLALGQEGSLDSVDFLEVSLPVPGVEERRELWAAELPDAGSSLALAEASLLDLPQIAEIGKRARLLAASEGQRPGLAQISRARAQLSHGALCQLAQYVPRQVQSEALVLHEKLQAQVELLVRRCRRRESLWSGLGASARSGENRGVRALFVGESGTGKTLTASYVSSCLAAPLYRVDLASVMNKYIGESEKNLARVLDAAAASDVILLLDEADSLFGQRTDGGETGERYANMLTNYLLTRVEQHPGIVLLTANSLSRIDTAFLRRFDSLLEFPRPGPEERRRLWESHLGGRSPGAEFCQMLGNFCDFSGGGIRNAVLHAASLSEADASVPLTIPTLVAGIVVEYQKLGRDVPVPIKRMKE